MDPTDDDNRDDGGLTFKVADQPWEFEQIHRLNYRTFVDEIPQHAANDRRVLVDRFHDQNTYLVALRGRALVAMVALRCQRPFSLDQKLGDLDRHLPAGWTRAAEIRLLATDKAHRGSRLFYRLLAVGADYMARSGFDLALISGTTRQLKLYRHLGFVPFGPLIGTPGAMYQPMYLTRDRFEAIARSLRLPVSTATGAVAAVSFLPGPVEVSDAVRQAFAAPPISHRSDEFLREFEQTRASLRRLTNAPHVQIMTGPGTLANDIIAAQLSLNGEKGLVVAAGEFGDRLLEHARRAGLDFKSLRRPWGAAIDPTEIDTALAADPAIRWLWTVHCETSTGVLNDLPALTQICARRGVRLCLDAISSLGSVPVDLAGVHLASASSGKGLRAYPGLCMVFHDRPVSPAPGRLPRVLDLGLYAECGGVPFTLGSNLLRALKAAVAAIDPPERFARTAEQGAHVRRRLLAAGLDVVAPEAPASPAVITIAFPPECRANEIGHALARDGFQLACQSDYLRQRNWLQLCLMGDHDSSTIDRMLKRLARHCRRAPRLTTALAGPTTAACPPTTGSPSSGSSTSPSSSATSSGRRRSTAASSA